MVVRYIAHRRFLDRNVDDVADFIHTQACSWYYYLGFLGLRLGLGKHSCFRRWAVGRIASLELLCFVSVLFGMGKEVERKGHSGDGACTCVSQHDPFPWADTIGMYLLLRESRTHCRGPEWRPRAPTKSWYSSHDDIKGVVVFVNTSWPHNRTLLQRRGRALRSYLFIERYQMKVFAGVAVHRSESLEYGRLQWAARNRTGVGDRTLIRGLA